MSSEDDVKFKSTLVNELKLVNDGVPPTPPAGETTIYAKSDKKIYYLDDQGVERPVGGGSSAGGSGTWLFTGATSGDPGNFNLGFNNALPASVTQISVYKTDFNNVSQTVLIASMSGGDQLYLKESTVGSKLYTLNSPANDAGTYFIFNVTFESEDQTNNYSAGSAISVDTMIQNPWDQQLNTTDTPTFAGLNLTGVSGLTTTTIQATDKITTTYVPSQNEDLTNKLYVDQALALKMDKVATTTLDMNSNDITNVGAISLPSGDIQSQIDATQAVNTTQQALIDSNSITVRIVDSKTRNIIATDAISTTFQGQVILPGGDIQTQIDNATGGSTTGLALKMDKIATTPLDMNSNVITNAGGISSTGLVETGAIRPKNIITGLSDIGEDGRRYKRIYLTDRVTCGSVDCDGNVLTGDIIPKVTENRDVGSTSQKYRSAYFSNTVFTGSVDADAVFANSTLNINGTDVGTTLTGLRTDTDTNSSDVATLKDKTTNQTATVGETSFTGIVKTDTINPLTITSIPLLQDDFTGATLKNGGTLVGFSQPGFPIHDVGNAWIQMTNENSANATGYLYYTDPTILSPISSANEWYCKSTFFYTDSNGDDGQTVYAVWAQDPPNSSGIGTGLGYRMMYFPNVGSVLTFYNGIQVGTQPSQFPPNLTPNVDHLIEWKIVKSGGNITITTYVDGVSMAQPFTEPSTQRVFTTNYLGVGAYTAGTTTLACNYFFKNIEINTGSPDSVGNAAVTVDSDMVVTGSINGITPVGGLFAQISDTTFTAVTTPETKQMIGNGVGSLTVPANGFKVGDSFHLKCGGLKTNNNGREIQIMLKSGSVTIAESGVIPLVGMTNAPWEIEIDFTIRAVGAAGTANINTNGQWTVTDAGVYLGYGFNNTNSTTFDTTIENTLSLDIMQSDAGDFVSVTYLVLSKIF